MTEKPQFGKGMLLLLFSKGYFLVTGYALYILLTRFLGPELFGVYGIVIGLVSMIGTVLLGGSNQAVSKYIAGQEASAENIKHKALQLQAALGSAVFILFWALSKPIAGLFDDPSLAVYFRLASPIILFNSFYGVYLGYLNGLKDFRRQAGLEVIYASAKILLMVLLVSLGYSLEGALGGFVLATMAIVGFCVLRIGRSAQEAAPPLTKIAMFQVWIMIYTLLINLLLNIDLFWIKAIMNPATANFQAGLYNAALTIARIPYFVVLPLSAVIFPAVSASVFRRDAAETRYYIAKSLKSSIAFLSLGVALIATNAKALIELLYTQRFSLGSEALAIVSFGTMFYSLITVATTIIAGAGFPRPAILILGASLAGDCLLNGWLIPRRALVGAALANSISMGMGAALCMVYLKKKFGAFVSFAALSKLTIPFLPTVGISLFWRAEGILLLIKITSLTLLYFALLLALKEIQLRPQLPFITVRDDGR